MNNTLADASPVEPPVFALPQRGAWVAQLGLDDPYPQIAKVREAHQEDNALDLVFYSGSGERIGRVSPAMGGPKGFEPFCCAQTWVEIESPPFEQMAKARWGWRDFLVPLQRNVAGNRLEPAREQR